ncbi:Putative glutathione synthase, substrate-binding domain, glutathione synthase, alpha-helical [Septoria linicola]|uniref:Glutathione synthetase n=1 Tax=Septoria linicola TaxID=215465 RepID=A0A9Q9AF48_9PEZI|nr:putative glutathione synthase, substrate-binding domain, glutathione synthase, alpha-helical [Septoria linicola]USW48304.1 Putative glutathione synthase, substrate-binding domain, glutathione synthase, alpha-helical [Septoria linicola]
MTGDDVKDRVREIHDYRLTHGMLLKHVERHNDYLSTWDRLSRHISKQSAKHKQAPITSSTRPLAVSVLPTAFPRNHFEHARDLQTCFNELYIRLANNHTWLSEVRSPLLKHDAFLASLSRIYENVRSHGRRQNVVCGIFRSDYMLDAAQSCLKQVETNVFSASGFAHAQNVAKMHRHLRRAFDGHADPPENNNGNGIADMLAEADSIYRRQANQILGEVAAGLSETSHSAKLRKTCILMIVQPQNFNIADERPIEYALWDRGVSCYRCEWRDISSRTHLLDDGTLVFRPPTPQEPLEVSVVYYRAGYEAHEYDSRGSEARTTLEMSNAIKCPDIATHLTTCKTVQQALTRPRTLERFLPHDKVQMVRETFVEMHTFDIADCVLKANDDGGGHNVYRTDIPAFLAATAEEKWCTFTLMKLIRPPQSSGVLMTPDDIYRGTVVSELGVLGTCIWERKPNAEDLEVLRNDCAGWTLKTKPSNVDGMMLVKGLGAMDCPSLQQSFD